MGRNPIKTHAQRAKEFQEVVEECLKSLGYSFEKIKSYEEVVDDLLQAYGFYLNYENLKGLNASPYISVKESKVEKGEDVLNIKYEISMDVPLKIIYKGRNFEISYLPDTEHPSRGIVLIYYTGETEKLADMLKKRLDKRNFEIHLDYLDS